MSDILTYRRYLHNERMNARARQDKELESVWRAKQEAQPGTAIPASVPYHPELAMGGYEALEDLDGADSCELVTMTSLACGPGLTHREADQVMAALAAL
jgi:hypothetical protein